MGSVTSPRQARNAVVAIMLSVVASLAAVPTADAYVYWSNQGTATIGRANLDGTGANQGFVSSVGNPHGLTVDGAHMYWANFGAPAYIARANLNGTARNVSFIPTNAGPRDVEIDGNYVYWANGATYIGRAKLDGTAVQNDFINAGTPRAIAVDGSHIWWTNTDVGAIGRANLGGSGVNPAYIPVPDSPSGLYGLAVNTTHVYWSDQGGDRIGRANVDSTGVVANFIAGLSDPRGLDLDGAHLYWANGGTDSIGRANIDGTSPDVNFISGASGPWGVAVDALPLPPPPVEQPPSEFSFGKVKKNKRQGTAKLTVNVTAPGTLDLAGKGIKPASKEAPAAGTVKLTIRANGNKKAKLNDKGKTTVKPEVTYTPTGGTPSTEDKKIKLVKR
jgi:virginiamycin B lyase